MGYQRRVHGDSPSFCFAGMKLIFVVLVALVVMQGAAHEVYRCGHKVKHVHEAWRAASAGGEVCSRVVFIWSSKFDEKHKVVQKGGGGEASHFPVDCVLAWFRWGEVVQFVKNSTCVEKNHHRHWRHCVPASSWPWPVPVPEKENRMTKLTLILTITYMAKIWSNLRINVPPSSYNDNQFWKHQC